MPMEHMLGRGMFLVPSPQGCSGAGLLDRIRAKFELFHLGTCEKGLQITFPVSGSNPNWEVSSTPLQHKYAFLRAFTRVTMKSL